MKTYLTTYFSSCFVELSLYIVGDNRGTGNVKCLVPNFSRESSLRYVSVREQGPCVGAILLASAVDILA